MDANASPIRGVRGSGTEGLLQRTPRVEPCTLAPSGRNAPLVGSEMFELGVVHGAPRTMLQSVQCGHRLSMVSAVLGSVKAIPIVYMLQYYIPSEALSIPFAIQTIAVVAGNFVVGSCFAPTSRVVAPVWLICTLLDAAITTAVLALALPIAHELISEPDGTNNIYMTWILHCFWGYGTLGILSAGIAVAGVVQRCKQPKALQAQKAMEYAESFMLRQHQSHNQYLRDVDALSTLPSVGGDISFQSSSLSMWSVCQIRAYEVRWCIAPAIVCLIWACYAIAAGTSEILIAFRSDPPAHARPAMPGGRPARRLRRRRAHSSSYLDTMMSCPAHPSPGDCQKRGALTPANSFAPPLRSHLYAATCVSATADRSRAASAAATTREEGGG